MKPIKSKEGIAKLCFHRFCATSSNKRHFQLLELMVAAFILLVCIAPTMKIFTSMYVSEKKMTRENQRDHLARLVHADLVEQLYKREITLKDEDNHTIHLKDQKLMRLLKKYKYDIEGRMKVVDKDSKTTDFPKKYLVKIWFEFKDTPGKQPLEKQSNPPINFEYFVYVNAQPPGSKEKEEEEDNDKKKNKEDELKEKLGQIKAQMNTSPLPTPPSLKESKNS